MNGKFQYSTSAGWAGLSRWMRPGQFTYSSHPPLRGQVLSEDAQLAYALDLENLACRTSRFKLPTEKLSCIN